jgi:hypothetical protein
MKIQTVCIGAWLAWSGAAAAQADVSVQSKLTVALTGMFEEPVEGGDPGDTRLLRFRLTTKDLIDLVQQVVGAEAEVRSLVHRRVTDASGAAPPIEFLGMSLIFLDADGSDIGGEILEVNSAMTFDPLGEDAAPLGNTPSFVNNDSEGGPGSRRDLALEVARWNFEGGEVGSFGIVLLGKGVHNSRITLFQDQNQGFFFTSRTAEVHGGAELNLANLSPEGGALVWGTLKTGAEEVFELE